MKAALPGVDYEVSFTVPVFEIAGAQPDITFDDVPVVEYEPKAVGSLEQIPGLIVLPLPSGGTRFHLKTFRQVAPFIWWIVINLISVSIFVQYLPSHFGTPTLFLVFSNLL